MSEESSFKNLKKIVVKENIQDKNKMTENMKLLNDKYYTICLNYVQSISDIQSEGIEIIENNVKTNKRFQEKWFSDNMNNSEILKKYFSQLVIQLNDYTETLTKINELSNNINSTILDVMKDNITIYNKILENN